jgi:hypothetical protein
MAELGESRAAKKSDWGTKPMPEQCSVLSLNKKITLDQMDRIRKGLIPEGMDDKWFIYYEEDENKLYMHRSWSGYCVWIVQFEDKGKHYKATTVTANRDPDQHTASDAVDTKYLVDIISALFHIQLR